ncbi:MAG: HAD family hydrolase [Candidatus Aenigmarchaeota archaeon]|nr:HAD family hydrolase [Candidatus Aenigmarchaeota archaeon]
MPYKGVLFDVDDVLVNRRDIPGQLAEAAKYAIRASNYGGLSVPYTLFRPEWIKEHYGNSVPWYMEQFLAAAGIPKEELAQYVARATEKYFKAIRESGPRCTAYEDAIPALEGIRSRGFNTAAFSNSDRGTVIETLWRNNMLDFFHYGSELAIVGGDEIAKSPKAVTEALRLAGAGVGGSYVVGDTLKDADAGRGAGISPENTLLLVRKGLAVPKNKPADVLLISTLTDMLFLIDERSRRI